MAIWNKMIFSGSDAKVGDLDISTPSSNPPNSFVIEDGQVDWGETAFIPGLSIASTMQEGRVMIGNVSPPWGGSGLNLWVKNGASVFTGEDLIIPANGLGADLNNDGMVTVTDLLALLTEFGSVGDNLTSDIDGDHSVTVADLLLILSQFGATVNFHYGTDDDDSRPYINWGDSTYGFQQYDASGQAVGSGGYITTQSVTDRHIAMGTSAFFDMLPLGATVSTNVSTYMTQMEGLSGPNFEVFKYIYFTQTTSPPGDVINVNGVQPSIGGGNTIFNRAGVAGSPNGYFHDE